MIAVGILFSRQGHAAVKCLSHVQFNIPYQWIHMSHCWASNTWQETPAIVADNETETEKTDGHGNVLSPNIPYH